MCPGRESGKRRWDRCLLALGVAAGCVGTDPAPGAEQGAPDLGQMRQKIENDRGDLDFYLTQIRLAEQHAAGAPLSSLIADPQLPWGLRTVDGSLNNLKPGQAHFGAADQLFPRYGPPVFRDAAPVSVDPDGPGGQSVGDPTSYAQSSGFVFDPQPRLISNLIVDQTVNNPAAVAAAEKTDGAVADVDGNGTFFIPNVAPDEGLSAPYNAWFTFFGQFFDHGLDLVEKGRSGTIFMPLQPDDPLYVEGSPTNFMVLDRATNLPGPDGVLGTDDDIHEHHNNTTAFVDQNQTYTSHPSHQVFLREYVLDASNRPVSTGRLFDGSFGGMPTWGEVKRQARDLLGIALDDMDVHNVPLLATDPYGRFLPGANGFPQVVFPGNVLVEGHPSSPVATAGALRTGHAFLDDITHTAFPRPPPAVYDAALLDSHFCTGDGRGNENIGLTAVHTIFHAEHNRLLEHVKQVVVESNDPAFVAEWLLPGADQTDGIQEFEWNGERLFQAARFGTEMQYQHLVFEEFARKVQPEVNVFEGYDTTINPAIMAEFAHTVYRFGHSLLTENMTRISVTGEREDFSLIDAFLNPQAFVESGANAKEAAANIIRGMTRQVGNEVDEFITDALRNNVLGLPLDLASINLARGRDTGVPPLNEARRMFFADTGNSALQPYESWLDFQYGLRHQESIINFVAAYGTHPTVLAATSLDGKRAAARAIVLQEEGAPEDSYRFMTSQGEWATQETGLELVDFWVGGLAEKQMIFGGLLGSTFNFVFEKQMERLQDGDRFYYLHRNVGLNIFTQLEQNTFASLVMKNTNVRNLPADIFSRPAYIFDVRNLGASGALQDDPGTAYDESSLLIRMPDGTVRYTGAEHVVLGGSDGDDRLRGGDGDDTIWGYDGDDRIEGGDGNDSLVGGDGDDIITDLFGIDSIQGGDGHDVINAGPGNGELVLGGAGNDFVVGGADPTEIFGGHGNDFIMGTDAADILFGGEGDDWLEGGDQPDLLQGDNGEPFHISPIGGNDVLIGQGGNDEYDAESGDDIMVSDEGTERHEGMLGFDWVIYQGSPFPVDADLNQTIFQGPDVEDLRGRFDLVEGLSGSDHDDVLAGDDATSVELSAVDAATGYNNALNSPAQIALIDGLQDVLGAGVTSFDAGNIILGGRGSDVIEGRGGDDIIDGDRWMNVRISVRDAFDNEIGTAQRMGAVLTGKSGVLAGTPDTLTLQQTMFSGLINPGQLRIVREILSAPGATDFDIAVYSDVLESYDLSRNTDGSLRIAHSRGTLTDGVDTLRNIELVQFADVSILTSTVTNPSDLVPPGPVSELVATPGFASVTLTWANPADAASTVILRSTVGFASTPLEDDLHEEVFNEPGDEFEDDEGLINGTTYFYTVFARDAAGNTSIPAHVQATPLAALAPPLPVGALLATPGDTTVALTWNNPANSVATLILRSTSGIALSPVPNADQQVVFDGPGSAFEDAGLVNGTLYYYTAYAQNAGGLTSIRAVAQATPAALVVPGPVVQLLAVDFDGCNSTNGLGPSWTTVGTWYCAGDRARGESVSGTAMADVGVLTDTEVSARVRLTGTASGSGLIARRSGTSFYAARLLSDGSLQVVRVDGASVTVLGAANVTIGGTELVFLRVTGAHPVRLQASFNGTQLIDVTDGSAQRLGSGTAGLLSGAAARTQFDDFALAGSIGVGGPPPPPPPPPPAGSFSFVDDFDSCTSTTDLGANWSTTGRWYCAGARARGEVADQLATAHTAPGTDMTVAARIRLTGDATGSGVVARAQAGSYYAARLLSTQRLQIVRVSGGSTTVLADVPLAADLDGTHGLQLTVVGSASVQLDASFNGTPVASATDDTPSLLVSGLAGLLSGSTARTQFDDFTAGTH